MAWTPSADPSAPPGSREWTIEYDNCGNVVVPLSEEMLIRYLEAAIESEGGGRIQDRDGYAVFAPGKQDRKRMLMSQRTGGDH